VSDITVPLDLGPRSYAVRVSATGLGGLMPMLEPWRGRRGALVTDENVDTLYGDEVGRCMRGAGVAHERIVLPPGEETKSWAHLQALLDGLMAAGVNRDGVIVALGGGVIGDLTGLAASLLRRGVACVQVATSLIAQVDAAIGGKTAINTGHGKNLVGTFHQPAAVFAAATCLRTLPDEEVAAGMAEVVKYALLDGPSLMEQIEQGAHAVTARDPSTLAALVQRCARYKADIVSRDEQEGDLRRLLNLGHTVGHAVERASGYGVVRHGEAVAIGLVAACELSVAEGMLSPDVVERVRGVLAMLRLPVRSAPLDRDRVQAALLQDKKSRGQAIHWVLLRGVGRPEIRALDGAEVPAILDRLAGADILCWDGR